MVAAPTARPTLDGRSGGLSSPDDKRLFGLLRVPGGRGPGRRGHRARRGVQARPAARRSRRCGQAARRRRRSRWSAGTLGLNLAAPLFTEAPPDARTIVITCAASARRPARAAAKVADVIVAGEETVDLTAALARAGGPGPAAGSCARAARTCWPTWPPTGLLDELCLSVSPVLAGPGASRIIAGQPFPARPLALAHVLAEDGFLFCRATASSAPADDSAAVSPRPRGRPRGAAGGGGDTCPNC